jgi:hypothetical protein
MQCIATGCKNGLLHFSVPHRHPGTQRSHLSHVIHTPAAHARITYLGSLSDQLHSLPFHIATGLYRSFIRFIQSTMPSHLRSSNSRSYSFPPWVDSDEYAPSAEAELPDIDEEPFAHFLTPVYEEDDPFDGLSLSAGIVVPDGPRASKASKFKSSVADKWARYVKVNHTNLHGQYHGPSFDDDEEETFMQLEDDRLNNNTHMVTQLTNSPPRITVTEPTRGRAQELLTRKKSNRRRYSRTLSGHRHSWREPSPDLFTVDESEEDELPMMRRAKTKKTKDGAERRRSSRSRVRGDVAEKSRL